MQSASIVDDHEKANPLVRAVGRTTATKVMTPVALLTAALFRRWPGAARLGGAAVIAAATSETLKNVVHRRRPKPDAEDPNESFPSGHTASTTVLFFGLASMMRGRARVPALAVASLACAGVAIARLDEREHHVGDVVAGHAIGLAALAAAHLVTRSSWWRSSAPRW